MDEDVVTTVKMADLSETKRKAFKRWLRAAGIDPTETVSVEIEGDRITAHEYVYVWKGKKRVRKPNTVAISSLATSPCPLL